MACEESQAIFIMKVKATDSALKLIEELKAQHGDELLFHQSGGCCDGSAPMCYPRNEYMVGSSDVKLGEIGARTGLVDIMVTISVCVCLSVCLSVCVCVCV